MKNLLVKWALGGPRGQALELRLLSGPITVIGLDIPDRERSGLAKYQPAPSLAEPLRIRFEFKIQNPEKISLLRVELVSNTGTKCL